MSITPYGQYHSPYLAMGNTPVNGIDPDGGLFGGIRSWIYQKRHGGIRYKDEDGWHVKGGRLGKIHSETNFEVIASVKGFGYGGLGKISVVTHEPFTADLKVYGGFLTTNKDKGARGYSFTGPNVSLFEFSQTYDGKRSYYYIGKDYEFKGDLLAGKLETPFGDYKGGLPWNIGGDDKKPAIDFNVGVGAPLIEVTSSVTQMSKHGVAFKFGFQEDIGNLTPYYYGFSAAVKGNVRMNMTVKWDF